MMAVIAAAVSLWCGGGGCGHSLWLRRQWRMYSKLASVMFQGCGDYNKGVVRLCNRCSVGD